MRASSFLQSGQSANPRFYELECSNAAAGDLTLPPITLRRARTFFRRATKQKAVLMNLNKQRSRHKGILAACEIN